MHPVRDSLRVFSGSDVGRNDGWRCGFCQKLQRLSSLESAPEIRSAGYGPG